VCGWGGVYVCEEKLFTINAVPRVELPVRSVANTVQELVKEFRNVRVTVTALKKYNLFRKK